MFQRYALFTDMDALADGSVHMGSLRVMPRQPVEAGPVKVAVRPESWRLSVALPGGGAPGRRATLQECAYLGSVQELTLHTALGEIFVVSPELKPHWLPGQTAWLSLAGQGLSVVAA